MADTKVGVAYERLLGRFVVTRRSLKTASVAVASATWPLAVGLYVGFRAQEDGYEAVLRRVAGRYEKGAAGENGGQDGAGGAATGGDCLRVMGQTVVAFVVPPAGLSSKLITQDDSDYVSSKRGI